MSIINSVIKGKQPVIDTLNVTPTTSAQQITAPSGTDGYSPVNVSAVTSSIDANIVAGNIKKDVQILGVTGSYEGTTPTGTRNITANGVYDVTDFASADVQVPTTAPAYYIEKTKDANNKLVNGTSIIMSFAGLDDIGNYALQYAYQGNTSITGAINMSSLTKISGTNACYATFYGCTGITSVDMSSLKELTGPSATYQMFYNCSNITSVDMSSLYSIQKNSACYAMFYGCSNITNLDLSKLQAVNGTSACYNMFGGSTNGLTSVNLGSLILVDGNNACQNMFTQCPNVASVDLSSLTSVGNGGCNGMFYGNTSLTSVNISHLAKLGPEALKYMFYGCTALTELRFGGLPYTATDINSAFNSTLYGVTGCTVHFPSDWATAMASYSNITNGLGGTNTTVLFDLPAVTSLDLSYITSVDAPNLLQGFAQNNYFPNVTSINLSGLTTVSGYRGCYAAFSSSPGITSINLNSLTTISGQQGCSLMFSNCTGITTVNFNSLTTISGINGCGSMFSGCTSLTTLSFPALTTIQDAAVFSNMLAGVTGCTVHFPSNFGTVITDGILGGTNTTVLYDLPAA